MLPHRTGLIGAGYWGPNYVRALRDMGRDLAWVCDKDPIALDKLSERLRTTPQTKTTSSYHEVLNDQNTDSVIVATPTVSHFKIVMDALNSKKHVLVEKPITQTSQEAEALDLAAKDSNLTLMVGHIFLYNSGVKALKDLIDSKALGDVYEIQCVRRGHGPIRNDVNAMWDLSPHDFSIIRHLTDKNISEISAVGNAYHLNRKNLADSANLNLYIPRGPAANISVSWQFPLKERTVTVVGSKKMARFDDMNPLAPITIYEKSTVPFGDVPPSEYGAFKMITRDGNVVIPPVRMLEPLQQQLTQFYKSIDDNSSPISNGKFGVEIVKYLEAAQESMDGYGKWVKVR